MPTLNTVIKQASRGADLYFVFRFLRLLTMKYEKTAAYKLGIIDKKGKPLKRSSELESVDEKAAYTMLHRLVFKIRRLIEKVPIIGKSILLNYAAALFLLKEQNNPRVWTDENYAMRKLNEFIDNEDWVEDAKILREEVEKMNRLEFKKYLAEDGHTDVASIKNQVKIAMGALQKMNTELSKLPDDGELPTWWTNKVAIAVDKLDGMADYLDTQVEEVELDEKVEYVEYKFKNKNDAMAVKKMLDGIQLMSFDINDDNISGGELAVDAGKKDMTKYHKEIMKKYRPKVITQEHFVESWELDEMKMDDPKLLKIFDKLKKGSTVKIKIDSSISKGKDYREFTVTAKNIVGKGKKFEQEKITLKAKDNPTGVKHFLYNRDGKVTLAIGDMGASIADIKENNMSAYTAAITKGVK